MGRTRRLIYTDKQGNAYFTFAAGVLFHVWRLTPRGRLGVVMGAIEPTATRIFADLELARWSEGRGMVRV